MSKKRRRKNKGGRPPKSPEARKAKKSITLDPDAYEAAQYLERIGKESSASACVSAALVEFLDRHYPGLLPYIRGGVTPPGDYEKAAMGSASEESNPAFGTRPRIVQLPIPPAPGKGKRPESQ